MLGMGLGIEIGRCLLHALAPTHQGGLGGTHRTAHERAKIGEIVGVIGKDRQQVEW